MIIVSSVALIIITGASHTGKTALAQKLLEKYKYPYLSIDHIKMGLIRAKKTKLTPLSKEAQLTRYLWPIVCEIIKTAIENNQNLIVEGCYVPYSWQKDFSLEYLKNLCLHFWLICNILSFSPFSILALSQGWVNLLLCFFYFSFHF